jgi:hypothetical protein
MRLSMHRKGRDSLHSAAQQLLRLCGGCPRPTNGTSKRWLGRCPQTTNGTTVTMLKKCVVLLPSPLQPVARRTGVSADAEPGKCCTPHRAECLEGPRQVRKVRACPDRVTEGSAYIYQPTAAGCDSKLASLAQAAGRQRKRSQELTPGDSHHHHSSPHRVLLCGQRAPPGSVGGHHVLRWLLCCQHSLPVFRHTSHQRRGCGCSNCGLL